MRRTWERLASAERFGPDPERWKKNGKASDYLRDLKGTAALVRVAGVGQAMAVLRRSGHSPAGKDLEGLALELLGLGGDDLVARLRQPATGPALVLALTREVSELCDWLARYLGGAGVEPARDDGAASEAETGATPPAAEAAR
ncbi:MAG: hypothetical protein M5U13_15740 [Thermoanaerobaculia bacterium]|nr:hypothetical protein [Thermoanaerobaculia bacterium]